ncbi:uncharacterized protein BP5553_01647 [Venustampulla echinocandica]|uniref:Peptidase A2 domain-containing protein n=1 Tax=Venustampulla echinocandica TaxID=2656787 RepID=A0A370U1M5_9HELO|nr:uncharacterized protein BP5553_01647 [Venustampulla echinocandica]RDL41668.1 hypothetical protein BP5553_01647 [Venustampulla echinocandica]
MFIPSTEGCSTEDRWEVHRETICKLFLEEKKTLKEVRSIMALQNFHASEWKFESKLRDSWGLSKKLKKTDWPVIKHHLSKRARQNKRSEILLHGIRIPQHKVRKEVNRNRANAVHLQRVGSPILTNGVSIRTPPASPNLSIRALGKSSTASPGAIAKRPSYIKPPSPQIIPRSLLGVEFANNNGHVSYCGPSVQNQRQMTTQGLDYYATNFAALPSSQASQALSFSYVSQDGEILDGYEHMSTLSEVWLPIFLHNTPWHQFQEMATTLFGSRNLAWATYPLSAHLSGENLHPDERRQFLYALLPSAVRGTDFTPELGSMMQTLIPERTCGNLSLTIQRLLDPTKKCSVARIGELAVFLISNNILNSSSDRSEFVHWIMKYNAADFFRRLFQMKTPTVQAASIRLFESIARHGSASALQLLIDSGADTSILAGAKGFKFLEYAVWRGELDISRLLIEIGADVDPRSDVSPDSLDTPLIRAAMHHDIGMLRCLLNKGADPDYMHYLTGDTALSAAVREEAPDCIKALLKAGADVGKASIGQENVLDWTYLRSKTEIYRILLSSSRRAPTSLALEGIISAAKVGTPTLSQYPEGTTESNDCQTRLLEYSLCEAVRYPNHSIAVKPLLDLGVDPNTSVVFRSGRCIPLCIAAKRNDIDMASLLLQSGADIDKRGVLSAAAKDANCVEFVDFLVKHGANIKSYGAEALAAAVEGDNIAGIRLLLQSGADINEAKHQGCSAIQHAAKKGNLNTLEYLIREGANVNGPPCKHRGFTALHYAVQRCDISVVRLLLKAGAQVVPPPQAQVSKTLLEVCARSSYVSLKYLTTGTVSCQSDILKLLLDLGAQVTHPGIERGHVSWDSALSSAIRFCPDDYLVHRLLDFPGIDVNQIGNAPNTRSPIQAAAAVGRFDFVKELLARGANLNAPPGQKFGRTALQAACSTEFADIGLIMFLLGQKADVNAAAGPEGGVTAIQAAAIQGHIKVVLLLLDHGADVNANPSKEDGRMALDGAAEHGRLDMVQFLLNIRAKSCKAGETGYDGAIELAEMRRHYAVADVLRSHSKSRRG